MNTKQERVGMRDMYRTSRGREVRQLSSQIDMRLLRARVMGQDSSSDSVVQEAIAKRDQIASDLATLEKADSSQWTELRDRIDMQIDELEQLIRTMTNAPSH